MKLGETYYVLAHLWVVVSQPTADGSVVLVNFTTQRTGSDTNCVIQAGEHPFVFKPTVIAYEKAQVFDPAKQDQIAKLCEMRLPVSAPLLRRIQDGALVSDLTPQKVQAIIRGSIA